VIYLFLRQWVRGILQIFVRNVSIQGISHFPSEGPVLLVANHPNSFLDAILLACYLDRPIWSLARGDAFRKPLAKMILSKMFMIPIYRISEGKEYVSENDVTFQRCLDLFRQGEVVLIFIEGICVHQNHLLPLKKGASRLARTAWNEGIPLQIVPIGLQYKSFKTSPIDVSITVGKPWHQVTHAWDQSTEGTFIKSFNTFAWDRLLEVLIPVSFQSSAPVGHRILWIWHLPLFRLVDLLAKKATRGTVFYQSVQVALLVFSVPVYTALFILGIWLLVH